MADFVIPEWMETAADREARLERERLAEQRLIQAQRQAHFVAIQICSELVEEFFIEKVYQIVYFKDMGIRSRKAAIEFAEAAVKHMYKGGLSVNSEQDTKGGIMLHRWDPKMVPLQPPGPGPDWKELMTPIQDDMARLEQERKTQSTWIERARKAIQIKFENGQTKVVKQPRIIAENIHYAGKGVGKGPREKDGLGPSWKELYVGQRVMLTEDAIKRRETYRIRDQAGVSDRRAKGDTIMRAVRESAGVIIEAVDDMILQTDITYAPGKKTTNYVCYPGGGSYVRWDATKEISYHLTERLEPMEDGNSIDEIERRTDLIEAQDWETLDEEIERGRKALLQLSDKFVLILRDKAMQARIRAHYAKINRFSKEAVAERMKTPEGGMAQLQASLKKK